jgi:thiol-disulfide isomerase/thioredoxin
MDEPTNYIMDNYIFEGCSLDADAEEFLKNLANEIKSLEVGGTPPDFTIPDPKGKNYTFSKVASENDLTLVIFWASWCHKCEQEMPVIKRVYDKYHAKGFEIIGVSVDMDKGAWIKGIEQKGCNWINVSQLDQWESDVAKDYRIQSTPVMYLVDSKREIILSPKELQRAHMLETWMNANYK